MVRVTAHSGTSPLQKTHKFVLISEVFLFQGEIFILVKCPD